MRLQRAANTRTKMFLRGATEPHSSRKGYFPSEFRWRIDARRSTATRQKSAPQSHNLSRQATGQRLIHFMPGTLHRGAAGNPGQRTKQAPAYLTTCPNCVPSAQKEGPIRIRKRSLSSKNRKKGAGKARGGKKGEEKELTAKLQMKSMIVSSSIRRPGG